MNQPHAAEEPRRRATNAERERISQILAQAMSNDQLNYAEFDERSKATWAAVYRDELDTLVHDLVDSSTVWANHLPVTSPSAEVTQQHEGSSISNRSRAVVEPGGGGNGFSLGLMGGTDLNSDWKIAGTHVSLALMGGNNLDLRKARLSVQNTTIHAWACMGGIRIIVPEDVRVECNGFGIMGGYGVNDHESVTVRQADLPADAPVITIAGLALMGSVEIVRAARGAKV